jgi:nucleotide-binding universal stress UspA family protein
MGKRILVATDGSSSSDGAMRAAGALAAAENASVHVLSVVDLELIYGFESRFGLVDAPVPVELCETTRRQRAVSRQLERIGEPRWPVSVEVGERGATIARYARELRASLVMIGAESHHELGGAWRGETLSDFVRLATTPLLIVPASVAHRPRTALVGVDFSSFSMAAARAAAELLEPGGTLHLVHVALEPPRWPHESRDLEEWERTYQLGAATRLAAFGRELVGTAHSPLHVETRVRRGDPALELLAAADRYEVDLIAVGEFGHGYVGAALAGSVSTPVIHGAGCAVLVYPPRIGSERPWESSAARDAAVSAVGDRQLV